jgi:hypothetical protein
MTKSKKEPIVATQEVVVPIKKTVPKTDPKTVALEKQVLEMQEMIKNMQTMLTSKMEVVSSPKILRNAEDFGYEIPPMAQSQEDVPFRQYIRVMSLTNHHLTISTDGYGNGTVYNFINYGQIQSIIYEDLAKIIHSNPRFAKEGYFFVMDPRVVRIHNMEKDYEKILNKQTIDNILDMSVETIRSLLHNTTPHIKNTIASMVIEKLSSGEDIDLNKVRVVSIESGKDIDEIMKIINKPNENE